MIDIYSRTFEVFTSFTYILFRYKNIILQLLYERILQCIDHSKKKKKIKIKMYIISVEIKFKVTIIVRNHSALHIQQHIRMLYRARAARQCNFESVCTWRDAYARASGGENSAQRCTHACARASRHARAKLRGAVERSSTMRDENNYTRSADFPAGNCISRIRADESNEKAIEHRITKMRSSANHYVNVATKERKIWQSCYFMTRAFASILRFIFGNKNYLSPW